MRNRLTPLNIKDERAYEMARRLSALTGESLTEVVKKALQDRLAQEEHRRPDPLLIEKLREISDRCAARPVLDARSDDEIVGYDDHGAPL